MSLVGCFFAHSNYQNESTSKFTDLSHSISFTSTHSHSSIELLFSSSLLIVQCVSIFFVLFLSQKANQRKKEATKENLMKLEYRLITYDVSRVLFLCYYCALRHIESSSFASSWYLLLLFIPSFMWFFFIKTFPSLSLSLSLACRTQFSWLFAFSFPSLCIPIVRSLTGNLYSNHS